MFQVIAFYDLLEDRRINDIIVSFFTSLSYKTNRFHVAVHLFSNGSQVMPKCGKNIGLCACDSFVLNTTFWHLWSITEQMHGNMESVC